MQLTKENSSAFLNEILNREPVSVTSLAEDLKCNKSFISAIKAGRSSFSYQKFNDLIALHPEFEKYQYVIDKSSINSNISRRNISLRMYKNSFLTPNYINNSPEQDFCEYRSIDRFLIEKNYPLDSEVDLEIVKIPSEAYSPMFKLNDYILIDRNNTSFTNGQIYAYIIRGEIFVYKITKFGNQTKCTDINDACMSFILDEKVDVIGAIVPNVRF